MKQLVSNIFIILNRNEKKNLGLLVAADLCISVLDIGFLAAMLFVIHFYTQPQPLLSVGSFSPAFFYTHPALLIIVFFLLFTLKNTAGFLVSKKQYGFVYQVASRISGELIARYLDDSYLAYVKVDSAVMNRKISQTPIEFCHYVLNGVQQVFSQCVLVTITITAVVIFNPLLFPLLVLMLAPPLLLVIFLMRRKLDAARLNTKKTSEDAMQHLQEALQGFVESNVYQKKEFFTSRYHGLQLQLNRYLSEKLVIQNLPPRLMEVFAVFGLLVLVLINLAAPQQAPIQLVTIGAFMVAAYKIIPGIVKITNITGQVKMYAFAAAELAQLQPPQERNVHGTPINTLRFKSVCFEYPGKKPVDSLSMTMEKGDFVLVSGVSGKGKTSFINLLLGFLTPSAGSIYINGREVDSAARQAYWKAIAYVKQQPFLLHASIIENITLQQQGHDLSKLEKVLCITGIDELLPALPRGLDTIITENGKNISGGQRQRIVFARALYKDFDLLVLDEPFSELEEGSEIQLLGALRQLATEGKMILLVTHNNKAGCFCNKKILLDAPV